MGKAVGIDFGTKRTGIAITDSMQMIATALDTIATHTLDDFISDMIKKDDISCFVIGFPINLDGTVTDSTPHVKGFIRRFRDKYPQIPIHEIDERFTSKMSKNVILLSGVNKKSRRDKGLVDKISAVILLQDYIRMKD